MTLGNPTLVDLTISKRLGKVTLGNPNRRVSLINFVTQVAKTTGLKFLLSADHHLEISDSMC